VTTHKIGIPATVVNLVVLRLEFYLATCERIKDRASTAVGWDRTSCGVDNQQERGHQREENNRGAEDRSGGPSLDQRCNEDSTDALSRLVESLGGAHWKRRTSVMDGSNGSGATPLTLGKCVCGLESVGGKGCNGSIEEFKSQLVEHYASDVYGPIPPIERLSVVRRRGITRMQTCYASLPTSTLEYVGTHD
jgi:hypothetical protein